MQLGIGRASPPFRYQSLGCTQARKRLVGKGAYLREALGCALELAFKDRPKSVEAE